MVAMLLLFLGQVLALEKPFQPLNPFTVPIYTGSLDDPNIKEVIEIDGIIYVCIDGVWYVFC